MGERLVITVREGAQLLGVSERRLYALVADGALPEGIVIRLGRAVRLSGPRLRRWLGVDTNQEGPGPERPTVDGTNRSATSEHILRRSASDAGD
jgi:excisionase family DNA binding protein